MHKTRPQTKKVEFQQPPTTETPRYDDNMPPRGWRKGRPDLNRQLKRAYTGADGAAIRTAAGHPRPTEDDRIESSCESDGPTEPAAKKVKKEGKAKMVRGDSVSGGSREKAPIVLFVYANYLRHS